jgi:site-specific recombinase XerD
MNFWRFSGLCTRITNSGAPSRGDDFAPNSAGKSHDPDPMNQRVATTRKCEMRLYDAQQRRLYVNTEERVRFREAALAAEPKIRSFCLMLFYTGCRISEALELRRGSIQPADGIVTLRTLKKREKLEMREVPLAPEMLEVLTEVHGLGESNEQALHRALLWEHRRRPVNRSTAYRWIKGVMAAADIEGVHASPKGLRHGFGVNAVRNDVPLNMVQKWMGHAALSTTSIYTNAIGAEERAIASRMWTEKPAPNEGAGEAQKSESCLRASHRACHSLDSAASSSQAST